MTSPEKIDVLAAIRVAEAYCYDAGAANAARNTKKARAAVAELIEADKELQFIRQNGCAAETFDAAVARHDAALARVCGGDK